MKLSVAGPVISRLRLIVLYTGQLDALAAFYRALGIPLMAERHDGGPEHYSIAFDDVVLEIYPQGKVARGLDGVMLGFGVDSIDAHLVALAAAGYPVSPRFSAEAGRKVASFADPDGRRVRLVELG